MLRLMLVAVFFSFATAVPSRPPAAFAAAPTEALPRSVVVKTNANLRASPSLKGNVLGIAREGTVVQLLGETERWYWVKTEAGLEAWIHKTLAVIFQAPLRPQPGEVTEPVAAGAISPSGPGAEVQAPPAAEPPVPAASAPVATEQPQGVVVSPPAPTAGPTPPLFSSPEPSPHVSVLAQFQGLSGYLIGTLLVVLLAAIGLQVRTTRQLKRTMRDVDQLIDQMARPPAQPRPRRPQPGVCSRFSEQARC